MTFDDHVETLKDWLLKLYLEKAIEFVALKLPFLLWGPLGPITEKILKELFKYIIKQKEMAAFFGHTDFRTSRQGRNLLDALHNNHVAQESGSERDKANAEINVKNALRELIRLTN